MSDDNNHWKLENLFHSTLKTRAQPFFTVHCCQFTLKIDNILGILWIQSFKFQKPFFTNQGRADSPRTAWRKKWCDANACVCFDFIKAALPDNENVLLKFGNDGVNDTLLIYFRVNAHTNKNGRFQKNSQDRETELSWKLKTYKLHCTQFTSQRRRTISI